jgi:hypothetical protein
MLSFINFHSRSGCQPIAYDYGLANFKSLFAMRARTQFRPTSTFSAQVRVDSDDGFALAIYEVGTTNRTTGDNFYSSQSVVAKLAFPQPTECKSFFLPKETTFQAGRIYVFDLKYYDIGGDKCIKARASLCLKDLMSCRTASRWLALGGTEFCRVAANWLRRIHVPCYERMGRAHILNARICKPNGHQLRSGASFTAYSGASQHLLCTGVVISTRRDGAT